jgi:hypothetical protein
VKLKYYLRGLGIGIIITTIILTISSALKDTSISDKEVIARAKELGMVMEEDAGGLFDTSVTDTQSSEPETENKAEAETETETEPESETETETEPETETETETETEPESETETENTTVQEEPAAGANEDAGNTTPEETEFYTLTVTKGQVCRNICDNLAQAGIVDDSETLRKYLLERDVADYISIGTYLIPTDATMEEIADILEAGSVEKQQEKNQ